MKTSLHSCLLLRGLVLSVRLGWTSKERVKKQRIRLDCCLRFMTPPIACQTDRLPDTGCYDEFITQLKKFLEKKSFHLIEHLAHEIYFFIKKSHGKKTKAKITVAITKKTDYIPDLKEGVTFCYGDEAWIPSF